MPRVTRVILIAGLAALIVAGCGNKGALVLPDQPAATKHKKGKTPADSTSSGQQPAEPKPTTQDGSGSGSGDADARH